MAQQFIVEGNDGYILSTLCEVAGFGLPVGYTAKSYPRFVDKSKGIAAVPELLRNALQKPEMTNIGIVIDANDAGITSRLQGINMVIQDVFPRGELREQRENSGWVTNLAPELTIGLWIMPDNASPGYLEHFLMQLVEPGNPHLQLAQEFLGRVLDGEEETKFPLGRIQKALMVLFLAIQDEPGMSPVTAIRKGLLNHRAPLAQHFLTWFQTTFQLQESRSQS